MTASWMVASTLVTVLLAIAAMVGVRVAALYRTMSLRWVWVMAAVTSVAISSFWLLPARAVGSEPVPASAQRTQSATSFADAAGATTATTPPRALPRLELPSVSRRVERVMQWGWLLVSSAILGCLCVAALRLRTERRAWQTRNLAGAQVLVSPDFGPAIVGVLRPVIVLPEWVLTLDMPSQAAIVAHEEEHRRARDPMLRLAALLVVAAMPWNAGMWLIWRGLRRAIELDCDARVVTRGVESTEYARVLLGAWRSSRESWLPSTAFAERASALGNRVEHLMRPEPRRRAMRTIIGTAAAMGLVFVACAAPAPQRPGPDASGPYPLVFIDGVKRSGMLPHYRFVGPVVVETTTTPTYRISYRGPFVHDTASRHLYPSLDSGAMVQTIDAPASVVHFGEEARYGAILYYSEKYMAEGGRILASGAGNRSVRMASSPPVVSDAVAAQFGRMLHGIALSAGKTSEAKAIIEREFTEQRAIRGPGLVSWPRRLEVHARRDAALRVLLTTDADREKFDARAIEWRMAPGPTVELIAENEYNNFFVQTAPRVKMSADAMSASARERALVIIRTAINDEVALYLRAPDAGMDVRLANLAKRNADIRALVTGDDNRAKFDLIVSMHRRRPLQEW